jgi:hypothetical protein
MAMTSASPGGTREGGERDGGGGTGNSTSGNNKYVPTQWAGSRNPSFRPLTQTTMSSANISFPSAFFGVGLTRGLFRVSLNMACAISHRKREGGRAAHLHFYPTCFAVD